MLVTVYSSYGISTQFTGDHNNTNHKTSLSVLMKTNRSGYEIIGAAKETIFDANDIIMRDRNIVKSTRKNAL